MPRDENGNYTSLSEERKEHFWTYFTYTSPIDPETHLETWPETIYKQKYMPIFVLPSFLNIVGEEPMNLTVYARTSFETWKPDPENEARHYEAFATKCGLMAINYNDFVFPPNGITDEMKSKYLQLKETVLVFHITDRGFERGSPNGDCFDLKFFGSVTGQAVTHARVWNGNRVRVPDLVTRDFLNDVARYVKREEDMRDNLFGAEFLKWHNSFIRDAVLRELMRASFRKFRYMNNLDGLESLREWARENGASDAEVEAKAEANAWLLLRKTAWWFLWATFVGYASIIRFPENRQRMRTRLPSSSPSVWPLPLEHLLAGQHKSDDPIAPPPTPSRWYVIKKHFKEYFKVKAIVNFWREETQKRGGIAPPTPAKVYRLNRKRAAF